MKFGAAAQKYDVVVGGCLFLCFYYGFNLDGRSFVQAGGGLIVMAPAIAVQEATIENGEGVQLVGTAGPLTAGWNTAAVGSDDASNWWASIGQSWGLKFGGGVWEYRTWVFWLLTIWRGGCDDR